MTGTRRPLVALALGFALGTAVPAGLPTGLAAAGVLLAWTPLAPVGFASAGCLAARVVRPRGRRPGSLEGPGTTAHVEGTVASVPDRLGERVRFLLRTDAGDLVQASTRPLAWPLAAGDRVHFEARVREPEHRRNPGGRDRAAELEAHGVALETIATSLPLRTAPPSWLASVEAARDRFAAAADRVLPPRTAGLVRAVGAGDRGGVDAATSDAFARSGLAHLLSVSGLHLAVVALGAYRLLRLALSRVDAVAVRVDPRRISAAISACVAVAYAIATGAEVPVVRSALATAIAFGAVLLDREVETLNALALAGLAIVAADPGALLDVSFQLSFASVAGLALWSGRLRSVLPVPRRPPGWRATIQEALLGALCASLAATIATAPLVAFHFRRVSIVGIASNLPGVPLGSALTVVAAVAALATAAGGAATDALVRACGPIANLLLLVNDVAAAPRWGSLDVGSPGVAGVAACWAALLAAARLRGRWRAVAALVACVALLAPPHLRHVLAQRRGGLEITFLAVGQGDATAFLLPDGSAVIVDGGGEAQGRYDPGARDVVPWLRDAGVRRIAALFLSHPHPDHLLGLPAIAAAFPVERFFTNGRRGDELAAGAFARLPPPERFAAGDRFERAGVTFEALAPVADHPEWTENDASLVLRVSHGAVVALLCGDIEAEGEEALLAAAGPERIRADVVKIPHHGSATSSGRALVDAASPAYAIACVGHDNRFGFPSPDVVARWSVRGATVLRTDAGAVRFLSDGRSLRRTPASVSLDGMALAHERL